MLAPRQRVVLAYIRSSVEERGYPPTVREIAAYLGAKSENGASDHLRALEKKGYLTRAEKVARGIRITPEGAAALDT